MKRSKKYIASLKKIERNKLYSIEDALKLIPEISLTKFPGSIVVTIQLNLNDKQKKDTIRGSYVLPHSFGKTTTVLVVADNADTTNLKNADIVGGEELIKEIENNKLVFDVLITTPKMMPKLAKLGKVLGSKGLMPNPKNGTISTNLQKTVDTFKSGMKNFKTTDNAPITAIIGKSDMEQNQLNENIKEFFETIKRELKKYGKGAIKGVYITTTMGPKITLDPNLI